MNKISFRNLIVVALFFPVIQLAGQESGIRFFEGSFEEALELAKNEDKTIFVDAYTTWCGPCKRMKRTVFPDKNVGEVYNQYFINMAIDMETQAGKEFNLKYRVTGYPTLLFIDQDGEIVLRSVGAKDVDRFIALAESAIKADDRSANYAKEYENGKRDYEFMVKFIKSLNKAGKPSAKIAYDYLDEDHNLSNEQKALFIYEAVTSSDSRLFELLTTGKYKKYIVEHYSQEIYDQKIYDLCWATVEKGIEYGVEDLIESATKACKKESRIMYPLLETNAELALARKERDAKAYYSAALKKLEITDNEEEQNDFLLEMIELFPGDMDIAGLALKTVERSLGKNDAAENNYTLGRILVNIEKFDDSIEYLNKALEQAVQTKKHELAREISQWRKLAINRSKS